MPLPIVIPIVLAAGKIAGTALLKAKILSAILPLKAWLAAHLGAGVATVGTQTIAAAAAAAWWVQLTGGSEEQMVEAAKEKGAGAASRAIAEWVALRL